MGGGGQYQPSFPPIADMGGTAPLTPVDRQPIAPMAGMDGMNFPTMDMAQLEAQMNRGPAMPPPAPTVYGPENPVYSDAGQGLPQIQLPQIPGAGEKTQQAIREAAGKAAIDVQAAGAKEEARKRAEVAIATEKTKAENLQKDIEAVPILKKMLEQNAGTPSIPYVEYVKAPLRFAAPEMAQNLDLLQQNRLNLAAPLAKALGVNPTDKDFKATLDRIFDINSTRESRAAQIQQLLDQITTKSPEAAGAAKKVIKWEDLP
jgi:hypothetical protein